MNHSPTMLRGRHLHSILIATVASATTLNSQVPTAPAPLDSVVVVASRVQAGSAGRTVDVITRKDIAHSTTRTLSELLGARLSIDVGTRSPAQADVSIRGSTAEQVVILVDGVRMSDAQSAHYALDVGIPLSAIERIEIMRGPGSALYGPNGVGGVINVVTRAASPAAAVVAPPGEAGVRAGSFGTFGLDGYGARRVGQTSLTASLQLDRSDGHRPDTDYRIAQARMGATRPTGSGTLVSDVSLGVRDFGASDFYSPYNSSERTGTSTGDTRWDGALGSWIVNAGAHTRLHTDRFTLVRDNPAMYENRHRSWQTGVDMNARTAVLSRATLAVGTEAEHDQLSSARLGGRREWRGALYAESAVGLGTRVQLTAGARDDHASAYGDFLSPSVSASVVATSDLIIRGSAARGFRAPTWTERYYTDPGNIGNPTLQPERFSSAELGGRYTPRAATGIGLAVNVAGFVRQADRLIDWVRPSGRADVPWRVANVGTGTFRGIEGSVRASPAPRVAVAIGGSGLAFDDDGPPGLTGKYALRPVTRQITGSASVPLIGPVDMTVEALHVRRAFESAYTAMNVHASVPLARVRLLVDATNLSNASWLDASGHVAQGRAIFVGLRR
jgi:iron complex outermembrane receptor protein